MYSGTLMFIKWHVYWRAKQYIKHELNITSQRIKDNSQGNRSKCGVSATGKIPRSISIYFFFDTNVSLLSVLIYLEKHLHFPHSTGYTSEPYYG